ncbi:MAG: lysylphosphatidylglycerol synthase domain-containing protein [Kofleriaceae bacterium]
MSELASVRHRGDGAGEPATPKHSWWWVIVLIGFGALGVYLAAPDVDVLRGALDRLRDVPVAAIAIVVVGAIGLVITEAIRIAAIAWLLGERASPRDAWDAAVANHVMTAITPQVGLGEPTVAYTLAKRGMPWDAAVAIPFVKFTTSLALVFALGTLLVALGAGPPVAQWMTSTAIVWFGAIALVATTVVVVFSSAHLGARWIRAVTTWLARRRVFASERWQTRIASTREVALRTVARLAKMRVGDDRAGDDRVGDDRVGDDRVGRGPVVAAIVLVIVHILYYASYIAPLVGLALVLGDPPFATLCLRALVYLCFVFAMPTPGGAGPSEAAAAWFFGDLMPPADAIAIVVVFRASTFYLQLAIGALYLPIRRVAR